MWEVSTTEQGGNSSGCATPSTPALSGAAVPTTQHPGFLPAGTENSTPCTPWAFNRPMDTSHLTASEIPEDTTTKVTGEQDLSLSSTKWKICKSSPGCGATPALSAGWAGTGSQPLSVWFLVPVIPPTCEEIVIRLETLRGGAGWQQPPPKGQHNQSRGVPPHQTPKGVWAERWEDALKQDTATSPGRSLRSAGTAALAGGHTNSHSFWKELCSAKCYHPAQREISALFSSTATLRFITLGSSSLAGLGEAWVHTLPHVLLPPATQHQEWSLPAKGAHFQKGFLNSSSIPTLGKSTFQHHFQLVLCQQSIHLRNSEKSLLHLGLDEPTQRCSTESLRELRRVGTTAPPNNESSTTSQRELLQTTTQTSQYLDKITKLIAFLNQMHWCVQTGARSLSKDRGWAGTCFDSLWEAQFKGWSPELETKVTQNK